MKFSVIIPVYNSTKYVTESVKTITNQTFTDYELLLVDDGSTDNSGEICDKLAASDSRIKVIHKKNGGTSDARNCGLDNAQGEYIMFMDNDDMWNGVDGLAEIAALLDESKPDFLTFPIRILHHDTGSIEDELPNIPKRSEFLENTTYADRLSFLISTGVMCSAVWCKVIKHSLITENSIRFPLHMRNEDTDVTADLLRCASSIDYYDKPFYIYRVGHTYAQTSKLPQYNEVHDLYNILNKHISALNTVEDVQRKNAVFSFLAYPFAVWMGQIKFVNDERIKTDVNNLKKYTWIMEFSNNKSVKYARIAYKLLGFNLACKLLNIYIKKIHYTD